jgi:hypothetical protein
MPLYPSSASRFRFARQRNTLRFYDAFFDQNPVSSVHNFLLRLHILVHMSRPCLMHSASGHRSKPCTKFISLVPQDHITCHGDRLSLYGCKWTAVVTAVSAECRHSGSYQGETRRHHIGSSNGKWKSSHQISL